MWARVMAIMWMLGMGEGAVFGQATNFTISGQGQTWGYFGEDPHSYTWPATSCASGLPPSHAGDSASSISAVLSPLKIEAHANAASYVLNAFASAEITIAFDLAQGTPYTVTMPTHVYDGLVKVDDFSYRIIPYDPGQSFSGVLAPGHHTFYVGEGDNSVGNINFFEADMVLAPEPSSLGLLSVGAAALLRRRHSS